MNSCPDKIISAWFWSIENNSNVARGFVVPTPMLPEIYVFPTTVNGKKGFVVPIPKFPVAFNIIFGGDVAVFAPPVANMIELVLSIKKLLW